MITADEINQFFSFLYAGDIGRVTFWFQIVAGVVSSALLAGIVVIILKFRELLTGVPPVPEVPLQAAKVMKPWGEVMQKIESSNPSDWHLAVILADSILDGVLKERGLPGDTMGDRLKQVNRTHLPSLDGVWEAHKTRNRIAHETERVLTYQEAKRAVILFGEALRELGYRTE